MRRLLAFLTIMTAGVGCYSEHDASVVAIHVNPSATVLSSGEKMYFDLSVSTLNNTIEDLEVTSFDSQYGVQDILSVRPGTKSYKERIIYEAPAMDADSTTVEFRFMATDDTGKTSELTYPIKVKGGEGGALPETSSIVLYSPLSGKNDAFSFRTIQPFLSSSAASEDVDLFLTRSGDDMPLDFGTKTDIVFSRANNFDYSSATWSGLQAVFKNSIRSNHVNSIALDDIILVGREERTDSTYRLETVGVLKIMAVYDEPGVASDRIVFNLKTLKK